MILLNAINKMLVWIYVERFDIDDNHVEWYSLRYMVNITKMKHKHHIEHYMHTQTWHAGMCSDVFVHLNETVQFANSVEIFQ